MQWPAVGEKSSLLLKGSSAISCWRHCVCVGRRREGSKPQCPVCDGGGAGGGGGEGKGRDRTP